MKYPHTITTFFIFPLLFLSCSTGPGFERNNENDPKSDQFLSDHPSTGRMDIDEQRNIVLSWNDDQDNFEDGFIIVKKLSTDDAFQVIDTIASYLSSYVDYSKSFSSTTVYKISAFVERDDSLHVDRDELNVSFIPSSFIINDVIEKENEIEVFWVYEQQTRAVQYFDGIIVEIKYDNSNWVPFDTLTSSNIHQSSSFTFPKPDSLFEFNFKLTSFIVNHINEIERLKFSSAEITTNSISEIQFEIIDEITGKLEWKNKTEKVDGFLIYDEQDQLVDTIYGYTDNYTFNYPFNTKTNNYFDTEEYFFYLQPFAGNNKGEKISSNKDEIYIQHPTNLTFLDSHDEWLKLGWDFDPIERGNAAGFIIHRRELNNAEFEAIDTVEAEARSYVDYPDPLYKYEYKVTTFSSYYENSITLQHGEILTNEVVTPHGFTNNRYFKSTFDGLIAGIDKEKEQINIYDRNYNFIQRIPLYVNVTFTNYARGEMVYNVAFNKDENLIAFITSSQSSEYWNYKLLHIYDLDTQSFILKNYNQFNQLGRLKFSATTSNNLYINSNTTILQFNIDDSTNQTINISGLLHHVYESSNDDVLIYTKNDQSLVSYNISNQETNVISPTEVHISGLERQAPLIHLRSSNSLSKYNLDTNNSTVIYSGSLPEIEVSFNVPSSPYLCAFNWEYSYLINTETSSIFTFTLTNDDHFRLLPIFADYLPNGNLRVLSHQSIHEFEFSTGWSILAKTEAPEPY